MKVLQILFLLFVTGKSFSQESVINVAMKNIAPMSPTASSIARFGAVPVNTYSGSNNLSIPLMDYKSGSLAGTVSLAYSFNGFKVEEVSGWVGLGWTLKAGGMIGRTVRGGPDEGLNGYMHSSTMKASYMASHGDDPAVIENLKLAGKGMYDTEPDIFYYDLPGGFSGKFFYNQEEAKFYTLPLENIHIEYNEYENYFLIRTPDGKQFRFADKEYSNTVTKCLNNQPNSAGHTVSAWYLSEALDLRSARKIKFSYENGYHNDEQLFGQTKYFLIGQEGQPVDYDPHLDQLFCTQMTAYDVKRLARIDFEDGYLLFIKNENERCDLPGDFGLKKIELYDNSDNFIKGFELYQSYFGKFGESPCNYPEYYSFRLRLDSLRQYDKTSQQTIPSYKFEYDNDGGGLPSKLSYAQDYWGFYNGAVANSGLIPPFVYINPFNSTIQPIFYNGANRLPDFQSAKKCALIKTIYPTGGGTLFEYENNDASNIEENLPPQFIYQKEFLEGDHSGVQTVYEKTFVINEPANFYNAFNINGGAYVDVLIADIGCTFENYVATTCAVLYIEGVSPGTVGYTITSNLIGKYLPNGTYKLRATFNQSPAQFQDFYFEVKWRHPNVNSDKLVGGIRVKKTIDFDGINSANNLVKSYSYNDENGTSSGRTFSPPFNFVTPFKHELIWSKAVVNTCVGGFFNRFYKKISSYSSNALVFYGGVNPVCYEKVTTIIGENTSNGSIKETYSIFPDLVHNNSPFPVSVSREWKRGKKVKEQVYSSTEELKAESIRTFGELITNLSGLQGASTGLKIGFNTSVEYYNIDGCEVLAWAYLSRKEQLEIPMFEEYSTITGADVEIQNKTSNIELNKSMTVGHVIKYNANNYLQNFNSSQNSDESQKSKKVIYSADFSHSENQPNWLNFSIEHQYNQLPIEEVEIISDASGNERIIGGTFIEYWDNSVYPKNLYQLKITNPIPIGDFNFSNANATNLSKSPLYELKLELGPYDSKGNLLVQKQTDNTSEVYLWGYGGIYPVAKIIGSNYQTVAALIDQTILDNPNPDISQLQTLFQNLRSGLANTKALITTYIYKPLVGVVEETDINGRSTYFEYDNFNRLKLIRDKDHHILKSFEYQYQQHNP